MAPPGVLIVLLALGPPNTGIEVASVAQEAQPSPKSAEPTKIVDGRFARYLEAPGGKVDGVVLEDGTVARFAPRKQELETTTFRKGDAIRVGGDLVLGLAVPYLVHAWVSRGDVHVTGAERLGEPGAIGTHADAALDTSTTKRHAGSSGHKATPPDATLADQTSQLARKRKPLKAAAREIRRLTQGSGDKATGPRWSRRGEDEGP
jgi:hypothetical protein